MPELHLPIPWRDRRLRLGLSGAVVVALLAYPGVSLIVAERLTKPYRRALASSPAVFDLDYEDVSFPSAGDDIDLRGWFLPVAGSDRVVVIVHGRNSNRTGDDGQLVSHAAALVDRGYNVLLFDFRAHGESGGLRYTLGAAEQRDVLGAVAYLEARGFAPDRTGFWAHSMGAATVLLTASALAEVAPSSPTAASPASATCWPGSCRSQAACPASSVPRFSSSLGRSSVSTRRS